MESRRFGRAGKMFEKSCYTDCRDWGLMEQDEVTYDESCCLCVAIKRMLWYVSYSKFWDARLAAIVCAAVCGGAS